MNVTKDLRLSGRERKDFVCRVLREHGIIVQCVKKKTGWSAKVANVNILNHKHRRYMERTMLRYSDKMTYAPSVFPGARRQPRYFFLDVEGRS